MSNATIIQDCIEDEFYQSTIKVSKNMVNSGLWTRSIYDPEGLVDFSSSEPTGYTDFQVRKRMLAACKNTGKPFVVAMYRRGASEDEWEKWRQETFKMNSLHGLIGIYEEAFEGDEVDDQNLNNLPTLHLLKSFKHEIPDLIAIPDGQEQVIRSQMVQYLSNCFGTDDSSIAESLLLCLVSRPSMRVDGLVDSLFIGKLTLNLSFKATEGPQVSVTEFTRLLKAIKPLVAGPVKLESGIESDFTKTSVYPRLDLQSGQLVPGAVLQQPDGCVLIIDETVLSEGEFKDQAVCNLQALIDVIRLQQVNYDFGMQQVTLKTDMPVISISHSKKSILPFDLRVECDCFTFCPIEDEKISLFRSYLEHCRGLTCSVDEEMATFLEHDYLALRKASPLLPNGNPKMNEQEFHRLMNLARLTAISEAQTNLSQEIWERTKTQYL